VRGAVRAGVPRVSADLIYAVPDEPPEEAAAEARTLVDVGLSHLSAYALTIEPNTRFGELARRGRLPLADEGKAVASMFAVEEALAGAGLRRYEVSNFARPGEEARHNLGYWRGDDYLALGCAAYGTLSRDGGDAVRWRNDVAPSRYMDRALARPAELATQVESLDGETRLRERIMLGLRLTEGVDLARAARDLGASPWTAEREREAERLVARGRLRRDGDRLSVPRDAWIWVDDTAARLF
jgi:oxygen-independent coproporphyrinogen-3 oxidase